MFAAEWWWQGVWNSFPFLVWDLSMQPRTQIWFSNQFICTGVCAWSSNFNYTHKIINVLKTQLMHKNVETNPEKSQKFTQHSCCSMSTREKKFKAIRHNGYRFVPKGGVFPTENHHACCEKLQFVRSIYPNLPPNGTKNLPQHVDATPW